MQPSTFDRAATREGRELRAWIQSINPLRGLTTQGAQQIYDAARRGDTVRLQWLYNEIEGVDPTLLVCVERRGGALVDLDWTVRKKSARRVKGYDDLLADDQAEFIESVFGAAEDANLWDAVEHLSLGFFRGFSHVAPVHTLDGLGVERFDLLHSWNFVRDIPTGQWFWNPEGTMFLPDYSKLEAIPARELASVVRPRHINYPALSIYLRAALGEKSWGQFVEKYGIPPVTIIMPPDVPPELKGEWTESARKLAEAGSGALPHGSIVNYADGGKGQNPFTQFLDHNQQLVVLMATGGMFTSLTGSTGLGQGASKAHQETWRAIVQRDAAIVAAALNTAVTDRLLDLAFPGKPHLAAFGFETEARPTPNDIFETAAKAKAAGYRVERAELEERTGFTLEDAPENPANGVFGGMAPGLPRVNARNPVANPLQNANAGLSRAARGKAAAPNARRVKNDSGAFSNFKALQRDLAPFVEELAAILEMPETEQALAVNALRGKLSKLPQGRALAEALELEIAEAFAAAAGAEAEGSMSNREDSTGKLATNECKNPGHCRLHDGKREPETKGSSDNFGTTDETKLATDQKLNMERGKAVATHLLGKKSGEEPKAMYRKDTGWIGMDYGAPGNPENEYKGGHGLSHITAKHKDVTPQSLTDLLQSGEAYKHDTNQRKLYIIKGESVAVVSKDNGGRLLVTSYENVKADVLGRYKSKGRYHAKGEN